MVAETEERLSERVAAAVDEAQAHLAAALEAFQRADRLTGEGTWCAELMTSGSVTAWSGRTIRVSPRAAGLALQAVQQVEVEARERAERVEARRREEETLAAPPTLSGLPGRTMGSPPGSVYG